MDWLGEKSKCKISLVFRNFSFHIVAVFGWRMRTGCIWLAFPSKREIYVLFKNRINLMT